MDVGKQMEDSVHHMMSSHAGVHLKYSRRIYSGKGKDSQYSDNWKTGSEPSRNYDNKLKKKSSVNM